jgi:Kef-type K+ transport system membrane component KefB
MLDRGIRTNQGFSERELVKVCAAIFGSALIAESIGLHATVGGFIAGIIVPRSFARSLISRLEPITVVVLLPFFFTLTGMTTYLDFNTGNMLEIFLLATLTSMVGKFGGTALAARWLGEGWPVAITLGILMQTKGMMEVVILTILQDAHVISGACFSALLLMALTTTALTTPMLRLFLHFSPNPELRGNPEIPPEDS